MDGYRFSAEVAARFNETDAQGIIHHGVHVIWFEIARIAYLARIPGGYAGLVESGVDVTTIELYVRYREGVGFNDELRVWTRCTEVRGARLRFEYMVVNESGSTVAEGWTSHACVDASTLRARRAPEELVTALAELEQT
ncbi:MAG: acyl-CoA thioesterase [Gaiellaceae bacterium]